MISLLISKLIQLFSVRGKQLDVHTKPIDALQAESLESRILYSAAPVEAPVPEAPSESAPEAAEVVPAAAEAPPAAAEAPAPEAEVAPLPTGETEISAEQGVTLIDLESGSETASTEIVFISSEVFDHQSLAANVSDGPEIIVLDGTRDGVSQIAEALAGRTGIDAVHLFTHGSTGSLELGTATLNSATMTGEYADELSVIQGSLSADADLLIYGCNFGEGEAGYEASSLLSSLLGADVAASTDTTGAEALGGDWDLEAVLGAIETRVLSGGNWQGILGPAVPTVDLDASNAGSDFSTQFTEFGAAVNITDVDAEVRDADDTTVTLLRLAPGGVADDADEILTFGGDAGSSVSFGMDGIAAATQQLTVNGTILDIDYDGSEFLVTNAGGGGVALADADALLAATTYENSAGAITPGDRTFAVSANDGTSESSIATSTVDVVRDYLTVASNDLTTAENTPIHLGISVAPDLLLGGPLENVIETEIGFRASNAGTAATSFTIPANATSVVITGYSNRPVGTAAEDIYNDDYQLLSARISLTAGTSNGTLSRIENLANNATRVADQFSWNGAELGASILSGSGTVSGDTGGGTDPLFRITGNILEIVENHDLQTGYHVEFVTNVSSSSVFTGTLSDVQQPGDTSSTLTIPADTNYLVVTENSAAPGSNFQQEYKNYSRIYVDLDTMTASGTVMAEIGETGDRAVAYSFKNLDISTSNAGGVLASTATIVGDTAGLDSVRHSPNIFINGSGELVIERTAQFAAANFTTMYTAEAYERVPYSSISTVVGSGADDELFDATAGTGKVNTLTYNVPASAKIGVLRISMATIGGNDTNENMGSGFAVIDLENGTSSGSFMNIRATTPDLVSWTNVSLTDDAGTAGIDERVFFTDPNTVSNRAALNNFTDGWGGTGWLDLTTNPDSTRTLSFNAISDGGDQNYRDYQTHGEVTWLGNEPFRLKVDTSSGTFSHGSPVLDEFGVPTGEWEVDLADLALLSFIPDTSMSGDNVVNIELASSLEVENISISVTPVANTPDLTLTDAPDTNEDTDADLSGSIVAAVTDTDGSESVSLIEVSSIPDGFTLTDGVNTFTAGGGTNEVDVTTWNMAGLILTPVENFNGTVTLDVRSQTTDTATIDGLPVSDTTETTDTAAGTTQATGSFDVTFLSVNDAPVADDSAITVDEESTDTPLGLTAPTDVDGPAATITVTGLPSVGTVTLADGTAVTNGMTLTEAQLTGLQFDAPADLLATTVTSFTYTVDDGVAAPVTGTTSITVDPVNDAPDLVADTFTVDEDGSVTVDVLDNDSDVEGDALTITHVDGLAITEGGSAVAVTNGTVALVGGELVFTPAPDYSGPASFSYTVSDGTASSTASVSGTVNEVPEALTISDVSADESGVLTFTVTLDNAVANSFTVDLAAISGSAAAGIDFSASQTLTFAGTPGETQTFTVTPVDDAIIEIDETFTVVMSNSSNLAVDISDTAIGTIVDNDARPAGLGITTDIELVANGSGGFDLVIEDVETNSPVGFDSDVPVADSADDLFIERVGDNYVIRDEGGLALGSPIIDAMRGADNEIIVPVAMVTGDIIFRTGIEDDTVTVGDLGATLAGGLFIDTEDPANRFNDFDVIDYGSNTAMAAGSDAVFRAETINALESARLEAGGAGTVTWDAGRNISMAAGSLVASADGDITYEANLAGQFTDNFTAVRLKGAEVASTSGNVDVDGRAGATGNYNRGALLEFGSAIRAGGQVTIDGTGGGGGLYGTGVAVHGSTVESTGAGPVRITGTGGDGTLFNEGISIQNWSAIDAGSGDLILDGTGGSTGHYNRGINAGASSFRSSGGDITVDGTGGGSGLYSMGARFTVSSIATDGTGTITMRGTGAGGTLGNMGLQISSGSTVSTADGAILLEGTGDGSSLLNHGVQVTKSTVSASGAGTVTVIGTGGAGTIQNQGVEIGGSTVAVNDGKLTITGTGLGTVINNKGVNVFDSTLSSSGVADIEVTGTGSSASSSSQNVGAYFGLRTIVTASGTGNVTLTGTGGTGSIQNHGVILETNASVSLASGNLVVTGTGGGSGSSSLGVGINAGSNLTVGGSGTATISGIGANGTMLNNGVRISSFSSVQVADGDLTITGTGRGSTSLNDGIKLSHAVLTATGSGNIIISGTGSQTATGIYNTGINMLGGSVTTASGNLTMTGLGGSGTTLNQSIRMSSALLRTTGGGDIALTGTSNASTLGLINTGVYMLGVKLDGSGVVGIIGIGGGGTMMNHGVTMGAITVLGTEPTCSGVAGGGAMSEDEDGNFLH